MSLPRTLPAFQYSFAKAFCVKVDGRFRVILGFHSCSRVVSLVCKRSNACLLLGTIVCSIAVFGTMNTEN